ncbi:hypothetical protein [Enterococcus gallinarum]|uniref:hypothetical protein n=1 Tax=Enterococcus gallinarum TaxID=1353 RepID=UPI0015C53917|nr:hypothetical protein [Enterococcus gallinarum]MDT2687502.1 hypothetical protein [Enterococcus gallinarum]NQE02969.1 hypothetical protein [Enterococcus gallinarum]
MKFDSTVTLAVLVMFVSLISPIAVAIINNRHLEKMKQLDLAQENFRTITLHKRELFENYLKLIGEFSYEHTEAKTTELLISYYQILPYIPKEKSQYFRDFATQVSKQNFKDKSTVDSKLLHDEIIPTIKKEIQQLQAK